MHMPVQSTYKSVCSQGFHNKFFPPKQKILDKTLVNQMQGNGLRMEDHRHVGEQPPDAMGREVHTEKNKHEYHVLSQVAIH